MSLIYYLTSLTSSGWLIGLDLYRAFDTDEFAFNLYRDLFLNPDDIDIDAEIDNGVLISVGYQFQRITFLLSSPNTHVPQHKMPHHLIAHNEAACFHFNS